MKPVALISMPSLSARFPSFQLALLKPTLERAGIPAQNFSFFMYFGERIGWRINEAIADVWPSLVGEWIWTKAAFDDEVDAYGDYFESYKHIFKAVCAEAGCTTKRFRQIREKDAPEFIDFCVNAVDWNRFGMIGFSVVFQQTLASLALAKALKKKYPHIPIIFGGASLEDDIAEELMRQCPQVDFIHCGDGEETFPAMIRKVYAGESVQGMPGILWRDGETIAYAGRAPNFHAMDQTPIPEFDEYFYARNEGGYEAWDDACEPMIPIEAARGCWWGEKHHCTFCGLNRSGMEFRAKSPEKVIEQIEALVRKHGVFSFNAIDNIMSPEYATKLFGKLAELNSDIRMHYEIRPNFSRQQLGRLRKGGLTSVQPGVESLSTNVLTQMRKMTTGMRNIELIKWCTYYGIDNLYNILMRFPGETAEDYRVQAEVVPKLVHLQPPWGIVKARADRGSPMFTDREGQRITRMSPAPCYRHIYPKHFNLDRVSYYFEHDMENTARDEDYADLLLRVARWQAGWESNRKPTMVYRKAISSIRIEDARKRRTRIHTYTGPEAELYEYCADARTPRDIATNFGSEPWIQVALEDFVKKDLMLDLDGRYLSLALPAHEGFNLAPINRTEAAAAEDVGIAPPAPAPLAQIRMSSSSTR